MTQVQRSTATINDKFGFIDIKKIVDERGALCVVEANDLNFPFEVKRVFWIYGVPAGQIRGKHAHRTCSEVLIPLHGSFTAHVKDGERTEHIVMNTPSRGLYIPPMVWCSFSDFTPDCVCLCLTSQPYDTKGYIDDIKQFEKEIGQ